jgi:hypothetical protein
MVVVTTFASAFAKGTTTGVFARMLCRRPRGMWTQLPSQASTVSLPSV